jgi:hypothetical protein
LAPSESEAPGRKLARAESSLGYILGTGQHRVWLKPFGDQGGYVLSDIAERDSAKRD